MSNIFVNALPSVGVVGEQLARIETMKEYKKYLDDFKSTTPPAKAEAGRQLMFNPALQYLSMQNKFTLQGLETL